MKIWLGTTTAKWKEYKNYYFAINNYLKEIGCVLLFDWMEEADRFYATPYKDRNIQDIYAQVTNAIDEANAVIVEYSVPNFSSSHQINYALLKKKPTLVMRLTKDNPRFNDSYLEALAMQSPILKIREYTKSNYKEVIDEFIGYSRLEQGQQRYNIVLDKKQKQYLDWATTKYGQSRSLIIRELIDGRINKDEPYSKYISGSNLEEISPSNK